MGVAHLKRWHWMLAGLMVGLALSYVQWSLGPEGFTFGGQHRSLGQAAFERDLLHPPVNGTPVVKNLRVYRDGGKFLVEFSYLPSGDEKDRLKNGYEKSLLTTGVPFEPVADLKQTVNVGIHPAMTWRKGKTLGTVMVNMWPRPAPAQFTGWKQLDNDTADPGTGADVQLALRPASYSLTLIAPGASASQIAHLALTLNGRLLPPLGAGAQVGGATLWQTSVPRDAFIKADRQELHIARGDQPVAVREIRLLDPTYTVVDYLREVALDHPQVAYHPVWWTEPRTMFMVWTFGSVALIGGIWPTLVTMLGGSPPARAPTELEPQSSAAGVTASTIPVDAPPTVSIDDEVDRALAAMRASSESAGDETLDRRDSARPQGSSKEDQKDFKGAYYPVHRSKSAGLSLVELLVVIGIIALLLGLLMPSLARSRQEAQRVQCMSNMRQVGLSLLSYANHWRGAMFPPLLGDSQPVTNRWPVYVFDPPVYNPPEMTCPSDQDPVDEHTYLLNSHLPEHNVTYSNTQSSVSPSEVIVMGEKVTAVADYYMDSVAGDYTTKVDFYKHGSQIGSNYLYLDLHVATELPAQSLTDIDPWDPTAPTTAPSGP
jgi:prepilin-type processing-associated H-X9-DG protein